MTQPELTREQVEDWFSTLIEMNADDLDEGAISFANQIKDAALAHLRSVPEGYVSVPMHPTAEIIQAMEDRHTEGASYIAPNSIQYALWVEVYKAGLAASPPAGEGAMVIKDDGGFLP